MPDGTPLTDFGRHMTLASDLLVLSQFGAKMFDGRRCAAAAPGDDARRAASEAPVCDVVATVSKRFVRAQGRV